MCHSTCIIHCCSYLCYKCNTVLIKSLKFSEVPALSEREKVDRRCVEDAVFQYAALNVSAWYACCLDMSKLPMHGQATNTIYESTAAYHGAFMKKYSGIWETN